jgi:hypothetical protein
VTAVTPPKIMAPIAWFYRPAAPKSLAGGEAAVSPKVAAIVLPSLVIAGTRGPIAGLTIYIDDPKWARAMVNTALLLPYGPRFTCRLHRARIVVGLRFVDKDGRVAD